MNQLKRGQVYGFGGVLLMVLAFSACSSSDSGLRGRIIFTDGSGSIWELKLETNELSEVYQSPVSAQINSLSEFEQGRVLFGECTTLGECTIKEYDRTNRKVAPVRRGRLPTYFRQQSLLFFYDSSENGEQWLCVYNLRVPREPQKLIKAPYPILLPNGIPLQTVAPVVQLEGSVVSFCGPDRTLYLYDVEHNHLTRTKLKDMIPSFWRPQDQTLFCYHVPGFDSFGVDLKKETAKATSIPGLANCIYSSSFDWLVILKKSWRPETYDLFAHSLATGKELKIRSGQYLCWGIWTTE